jgi:hypothetical protein
VLFDVSGVSCTYVNTLPSFWCVSVCEYVFLSVLCAGSFSFVFVVVFMCV